MDGRANLQMDPKVVGVMLVGMAAVVSSFAIADCSRNGCNENADSGVVVVA